MEYRLLRSPGFRAALALVGVLALGTVFNADGTFYKFRTHQDLLGAVAINGVLAAGLTLVILTGGIDLSVGSVLAVSAMCFALFTMAYQWPAWLAILVCLALGALAGTINGLLITAFGMQPFVATLATMASARGLAKYIPEFAGLGPAALGPLKAGQKIQPLEGLGPEIFERIDGRLVVAQWPTLTLQIPVVTILFLITITLLWLAVTQTRFGRHLYAIGGNEEAARLSGISVGWNKVAAYAICSLCAGLAGICQASRDHLGDPEAGFTFELKAIAAVVIGGTSLMGGRGGVLLTFVGVLIIGYIEKILSINGVQEPGRLLIQGMIIVVAVIIQRRRT